MTRDKQMEAAYYTKKNRTPMIPWHPGFDMSRVSVSQADRETGHPKSGDMIAWSEDDKGDRWLVSDTYFEQNYVKAADATQSEDVRALAEAVVKASHSLANCNMLGEAYGYLYRVYDNANRILKEGA